MIAEQYGLVYKRVTQEDIELIRHWRNQPFIRDTMQFRDHITPEMQSKWFESINNKHNYYFIIYTQGKPVGLINCKNADPLTREAEGGIFIWDQSYWNTPIPVFAALTMLEGVFEIFGATGSSIATVAKNNTKAIRFNKMLGYEVDNSVESGDFIKLKLTKERYLQKTKKLKKAAQLYSNDFSEMKLTITESEDLLSEEIISYIKQKR